MGFFVVHHREGRRTTATRARSRRPHAPLRRYLSGRDLLPCVPRGQGPTVQDFKLTANPDGTLYFVSLDGRKRLGFFED